MHGSSEYGIDHPTQFIFKKLDINPLLNYFGLKFGIYILDQLHTFQNMQSYTVDSTTDIDS